MNFLNRVKEFYELNPITKARTKSRAQETVPRINLKNMGRYSYVEGLGALANHTRRSKEYVLTLFRQMTNCVIEDSEFNKEKIRGATSIRSILSFQKRYMNRILCIKCRSPQTTLRLEEISCSGCGAVFKDKT